MAPAAQMLQGLLGSEDEEQEDPKDYCKGEASGFSGLAEGRRAGFVAQGPGKPALPLCPVRHSLPHQAVITL